MDSISHSQARLLISKAWDHEITPQEAAQLAHHLNRCPACATHAQKMRLFLQRMERARPGRDAEQRGTPDDDSVV